MPYSFSILERIELSATRISASKVPDWITFSILERIELSATLIARVMSRTKKPLSVSSNGSNSLQPLPRSGWPGLCSSFSILERIELSATLAAAVFTANSATLSVSSNGSNSLQRAA